MSLFSLHFFQKLVTDFGLVAIWNGESSVAVHVPHTYLNSTCGLCGTLDGDKTNDFTTPDGILVSPKELNTCTKATPCHKITYSNLTNA